MSSEVDWLSDSEMAAWLPLINVSMRLPARLDSQLRAASGLTHYEYLVLAKLAEEENWRMGLSALAAAANSSPSRLSHVLRKLSERGYLLRHSTGRSAYAELTDTDFNVVKSASRGHVQEVRRQVFDHLGVKDVEMLARVLPKFARHMQGFV